MNKLKKRFCTLMTFITGVAFVSCQNNSGALNQPPAQDYAKPVIQPLKFSMPVKIKWDSIKALPVHPLVRHFDLHELPLQRYHTAGFVPFKHPVKEKKFNLKTLPFKGLDINRLSSRPLKFKTVLLSPPALIEASQPQLVNPEQSLYEFSVSQGLPGGFVSCSLTDHAGFVWFATKKGLYRYNGENLILYLPVTINTKEVKSMLEDRRGRIWICSFDGSLCVLDPVSGTFKNAITAPGFSGKVSGFMLIDQEQQLWVSNRAGGINIIDTKTLTYKILDKAQGLSYQSVPQDIIKDNKNEIWINTPGRGVNVIDIDGKKIKYLDRAHGLQSDTTGRLFCDRNGRIWLEKNGDINVIDLGKNTVQRVRKNEGAFKGINGFLQDKDGRVWIADTAGATIINLENRTCKDLTAANGFNFGPVRHLNQDRHGQVWVAHDYGSNMIGGNKSVVAHIGADLASSLLYDEEGLIWESIERKGFIIIDVKNKTVRRLTERQQLSSNNVTPNKLINGKLFIGTENGLDIIDEAKKTITILYSKYGPGNYVGEVTGDKNGLIWIVWTDSNGGNESIDVYNPVNNTVKHLEIKNLFQNKFIGTMIADNADNIWVSTDRGIGLINIKTGYVKHLIGPPQSSGFSRLLMDDKGNIWIGTYKGIYMADLKNKTLLSFFSRSGVFNEDLNSLLQYHNGIYAGTNRGVTLIKPGQPGKWEVEFFGTANGLIKTNKNNANSDMISKDGRYWWGDMGITVTDLSRKDTFVAPVYISGISIMDKPRYFIDANELNIKGNDTLFTTNITRYFSGEKTLNTGYALQSGLSWDMTTGPYNMPVNLKIPYDQNFIRFQFGSVNVAAHDSAWYRYILIGADKKWSEETRRNASVNYINLQPGMYTFAVIGRNLNDIWSKPSILSFVITPPWWQTWWAYMLYILLFAGTIWGFVTLRSWQLVKEKRILEHKVKLHTVEVVQQKEEIQTQRDNLEKAFSELKSTQTQLIQSEKMASLGELTAGIAHEIQNPLNFVNNFSEVSKELLEELKDELINGDIEEAKLITDGVIQNLEKINHHGKRADAIVKGMLEHSRSSSGQKQLTDINKLAEEYLRLSYHGLRAKDKNFNAEMVTHLDRDLPKINVIPQDIGRVFLNLFNNAFYAVNQKQKTADADYRAAIEVTTAPQPPEGRAKAIVIIVRDNGVGIPDVIKEKIMQPFFTTKPTGEGTGLGLSLTYDMVVKGHGGSIKVESKEGEGSEFVVSLPLN